MQQRSTETHARLLAAATAEFSAHGYDATGVAEICAAAGVSKGAFYHHFPSKQALFMEILEAWLGRLDERITEISAGSADAATALRRMGALVGHVLGEGRGQLPMFLEFWLRARRDPAVWAATIAPYRRYQTRFQTLVAGGIAEGSLRPQDPALAAQTLVSLAVGLILQGLLEGAEDRPAHEDAFAAMAQKSIAALIDSMSASERGEEVNTCESC